MKKIFLPALLTLTLCSIQTNPKEAQPEEQGPVTNIYTNRVAFLIKPGKKEEAKKAILRILEEMKKRPHFIEYQISEQSDKNGNWFVVTDKWQHVADFLLYKDTSKELDPFNKSYEKHFLSDRILEEGDEITKE